MSRWLRALAFPGTIMLMWELWGQSGTMVFESLSYPSAILIAGWRALLDGTIPFATLETFQAALLGLAIGTALGIALGIPLGLLPAMEAVVGPSLDAVRPIPAVALLPLALLLFGFGVEMESAIVAFGCTWPILLVTISAVRGIDFRLIEVGRLLQLPTSVRMLRIVLPAAIARISVGIRIAAGISLALAITIEIALNPQGLGAAMVVASQGFNSALLWAELLWVGIVGWTFNWLLLEAERRWLGFVIGVAAR
jgi:ABC-type nitrate/sulfonate/bicarbonate transport system permease component